MKALSLTQPYATLIAIGAKSVETRSWSTKYRGPLAIHAAAGYGGLPRRDLAALVQREPFRSALARAGIVSRENLPRGAIVAVCRLAGVVRVEALRDTLSEQELAFGDYADGRFCWLLEEIRPLAQPLPARGALGLWPVQPADLALLELD